MSTDLTRTGNYNALKHISALSFNITDKQLKDDSTYVLAKLPKDAVIINSSIIMHTVSSASSVTVTVNVGSLKPHTDVNVTSLTDNYNPSFLSATKGQNLTIKANKKATDVNFTLVMTMIEPNRTTGEYLVMKNS